LAEYFGGLLDDLDPTPFGVVSDDLDLVQPVEELWTLGPIGVAYDEPGDRIVVVLEELVDDEVEGSGATVKVRLSRAQVWAFVSHAREVVSSGRPPCRFCGLPLDVEGHACPRMN
jgi:uncharacterized repeat protein (TIGR03847 family)